ncbi:MAG: HEPN domain-containing protein [Fluviicola sp.]|nr:HEPN domain-containing protein [Fluviicola sp.]
MQSYRTELEQEISLKEAIVEKDVLELGRKIEQYKNGSLHEDKFRALRLARGVYGQRQQGVQMIRIKLPFGKVTARQLRRIAAVSDEYSTGHLHITTRQDIQIHYVSLDRTPQLWADLEKDDVTLREACGNTVRNVTASPIAGIDPKEPFDVAPYADWVFRYFLRKPFGQELGRKIKIAFSSNTNDDAYSFIHDFGFIPAIQNGLKGFKVLVGGGLGAQPVLAKTAYEFLPAFEIIPFIEASIRVFDRHGERNNRNKARLKYLIAKIGWEAFQTLVEEERKAIQFTEADVQLFEQQPEVVPYNPATTLAEVLATAADPSFKEWLKTNVFEQKQSGYVAAFLKVQLGNFNTNQARRLADLIDFYAADDARFTIDQSVLLKFLLPEQLEELYNKLKEINLADSGYNSLADVTACPGTDTCNLGISNSTEVARVIEGVIRDEFPELLYNTDIKIKISGCMNSCGQHGLAHIGFHGSSMKVDGATVPALQVLLGGGNNGFGLGRIAEKVIKLPSKRVLDCIRSLINDYFEGRSDNELFNEYYDRQGNKYFYDLLKPLADTTQLNALDYIDWGQDEQFKTAIGVGECAGVVIDLVATLIFDAEEKIDAAEEAFSEARYADAVYHTYAAGIHTAKALLLGNNIRCNTHQGIISDFDQHLVHDYQFEGYNSFEDLILQIRMREAGETFAKEYLAAVTSFVKQAKINRS